MGIRKDQPMRHQHLDCGCEIKIYDDNSYPNADIEFCDLHFAARDLLEASRKALPWLLGTQARINTKTNFVEFSVNPITLQQSIEKLQSAIQKAGQKGL